MKNNDEEKSIRSVISSMKLSHLKELIKVFEIQVREKRKEGIIEAVSLYIENSISAIIDNFIIYEEYKFIKKICDENYTIILKEDCKENEEIRNSLEYLGIVYSYWEFNEEKIFIPMEIRESIKLKISDIRALDYFKKNQRLIELFRNLLDIYGIIPVNVLIDYIIKDTGFGDSVHEAIKTIWKYNIRYNLYYSDNKLNYYNIKIIDIKLLSEKLTSKSNLNYKYYTKSQLKNMNDRKLNSNENEIYVVLKRYLKSSELTLECLNNIKIMIKNDMPNKAISEAIMLKTKRMSEQGRKIIERLVSGLRECYPLWTLKGHYLKCMFPESLQSTKNNISMKVFK